MDEQAGRADAQRPPARIEQVQTLDDQVGASRIGVEVRAELIHQLPPSLELHKRHLPLAALIRVAGEASSGDERRAVGAVHLSAMCTFDPDLMKRTHSIRDSRFVLGDCD